MSRSKNIHDHIPNHPNMSADESLRWLNIKYCIQNDCLLLHILDFETGYSERYIPFSDIKISAEKVYANDYMVFAYTAVRGDKKNTIYVTEAVFNDVKKLYKQRKIPQCLVLTGERTKEQTIDVTKISNNYYAHLYATKRNPLFLIKEGKSYRAVDEMELMAVQNFRKRQTEKEIMKNRPAITESTKRVLFTFAVFSVLSLAPVAINHFFPPADSPSPTTANHAPAKTGERKEVSPTLVAEDTPKHGWCFLTSATNEPNFTVETTFSEDCKYYYVKLVEARSNRQRQAVFIYAGQSVSIYVPDGTYLVRWVSGNTWFGFKNPFGNKKAQQAEETFTFDDYSGWSITLYPVKDGNLQVEEIDIDSF